MMNSLAHRYGGPCMMFSPDQFLGEWHIVGEAEQRLRQPSLCLRYGVLQQDTSGLERDSKNRESAQNQYEYEYQFQCISYSYLPIQCAFVHYFSTVI